MKRNLGRLVILALVVTAAGCGKAHPILAPGQAPLTGGTADLTRYVAMGTSISAGYQSGGLVVTHQQRAFPVLFAQQINQAAFTIPSISADGIPALLRITGVTPLGGVVISNTGRTQGAPTNFAQATSYHNLGVPGAVLYQATDTTTYGTNAMFGIIQRGKGSILAQVLRLHPTFVSVEYGANELLGPGTSGSGTPLFTPGQFAALYAGTLNGLQAGAPGVSLALFTVPDVTVIPFFNTFKPATLDSLGNPVFLIGPGGTSLAPGDLVCLTASTLLAQGYGFPTTVKSYVSGVRGNGLPLPDAVVLSVAEQNSLRDATDAYNSAIRAEAAVPARHAALVDMGGLLTQIAARGYPFRGQTLTAAFVTGGIFSLDGVHPDDLAHGILCNLLIDAVNARFGADIAPVDLNALATASASAAHPAGGEAGAMPAIEDAAAVYVRMFPWR